MLEMLHRTVEDAMRSNPQFAAEVEKFVAYIGWDLEEIKRRSVQTYLQLLAIELTGTWNDLKAITGQAEEGCEPIE